MLIAQNRWWLELPLPAIIITDRKKHLNQKRYGPYNPDQIIIMNQSIKLTNLLMVLISLLQNYLFKMKCYYKMKLVNSSNFLTIFCCCLFMVIKYIVKAFSHLNTAYVLIKTATFLKNSFKYNHEPLNAYSNAHWVTDVTVESTTMFVLTVFAIDKVAWLSGKEIQRIVLIG